MNILNLITDTTSNIKQSSLSLQTYINWLLSYSQCWWYWWCHCCCCRYWCRGLVGCCWWWQTCPRWNSWDSHATFSSSNQTAKLIKRNVGLLYQLLWDIMKKALINTALFVVRLCHRWVCTSCVDPSRKQAVDIVYIFGLKLCRGRMKICIETTRYNCACTINRFIEFSFIVLNLCSTSWTKLSQDPNITWHPGWQSMVNGSHSGNNDCQVDFINQWSICYWHLSYAIDDTSLGLVMVPGSWNIAPWQC